MSEHYFIIDNCFYVYPSVNEIIINYDNEYIVLQQDYINNIGKDIQILDKGNKRAKSPKRIRQNVNHDNKRINSSHL